MRIFLDSANLDEISKANDLGIIDGITTNPSIIAKTQKSVKSIILEINSIVKCELSISVLSRCFNEMVKEGHKLADISDNIIIKLPTNWDGIKACKYFTSKSIKTNMTLCFSPNQALLAAKAGAYYISVFIGRLDDIGQNGINLLKNVKQILCNYPDFANTKILVASIRNLYHFSLSAKYGADAVTIPYTMISKLADHYLTLQGLEAFEQDTSKLKLI